MFTTNNNNNEDDNKDENNNNIPFSDIGLTDEELALIPIKKLDALLKRKGISKERSEEIKSKRITLIRRYCIN